MTVCVLHDKYVCCFRTTETALHAHAGTSFTMNTHVHFLLLFLGIFGALKATYVHATVSFVAVFAFSYSVKCGHLVHTYAWPEIYTVKPLIRQLR